MRENQIFISHSSKDNDFSSKLYEDLLWEGYPVWMDSALKEAEEWKPQVEHHLRKSDRFIVVISSNSVDSKWVSHEGSIAYALKQLIIPLRIESSETCPSRRFPIWVQPTQLFNFVKGQANYRDQFKKLKQRLGDPQPILDHIEQLLILYTTSQVLLDEVALNLIKKHYKDIVWPKGKKAILDELIEKSERKLQNYWTRYEKLEKAYEAAKIDNYKLNRDAKINRALIIFLYVLCALFALYLLGVVDFYSY